MELILLLSLLIQPTAGQGPVLSPHELLQLIEETSEFKHLERTGECPVIDLGQRVPDEISFSVWRICSAVGLGGFIYWGDPRTGSVSKADPQNIIKEASVVRRRDVLMSAMHSRLLGQREVKCLARAANPRSSCGLSYDIQEVLGTTLSLVWTRSTCNLENRGLAVFVDRQSIVVYDEATLRPVLREGLIELEQALAEIRNPESLRFEEFADLTDTLAKERGWEKQQDGSSWVLAYPYGRSYRHVVRFKARGRTEAALIDLRTGIATRLRDGANLGGPLTEITRGRVLAQARRRKEQAEGLVRTRCPAK